MLLILMSSCKSVNNSGFHNDKEKSQTYKKDKNSNANKNIVKFNSEAQNYYRKFDSILILKYGNNLDRYHKFSNDFFTALKENKEPPLYTQISKLLPCNRDNKNFSTIWIQYKKNCFIDMNNGSYFKTLKVLSKNNKFLKKYVDLSMAWGTINIPSITVFFAVESKKLNFRDENFRIVFAIHYITNYYNIL